MVDWGPRQVLYLNLYDPSSDATLSNVAVDDAWWAANSAAATAFAMSHGVGVWPMGELVAGTPVDMTISDMGTWNNWIASQYTGVVRPPSRASSNSGAIVAVAVGVPVALLGLYALFK